MAAYTADLDPDHPDWIRWISLREDLRQGARERAVEHAVFALLRVLRGRYPEAVVEAGLDPATVLADLDLTAEERERVRDRLARDSTVEDPVAALPDDVRAVLDPDYSTSG